MTEGLDWSAFAAMGDNLGPRPEKRPKATLRDVANLAGEATAEFMKAGFAREEAVQLTAALIGRMR